MSLASPGAKTFLISRNATAVLRGRVASSVRTAAIRGRSATDAFADALTRRATPDTTLGAADGSSWMKEVLAVAAGGVIGAVARYLVYVAAGHLLGTGFPYGTLIVNVVGSFAMGVLVETMALVWSTSRPASSARSPPSPPSPSISPCYSNVRTSPFAPSIRSHPSRFRLALCSRGYI
jgi:CrcB-like protein, Camphor Resistance (CrcB)